MEKMRILRVGSMFVVLFSITLFGSPRFAKTMELDTDRPGMDYKNFDLIKPEPMLCERACKEDPKCRAWTYVKPEVQGPKARCWLKSGVPRAVKNTSCVSGVAQQVSPPPAARALPDKKGASAQFSKPPQAESKTVQGFQGQARLIQLPKETKFEAMAAQRLQQLRATADSKRKADLQHREMEIVSIKAKGDPIFVAPCDPASQALRVRYVYPKEVYPGNPVAIHGCNFKSKDSESKVVLSAAGNPYGPFWNYSAQSPKSLELKIDSWTDTEIKAYIPYYDYLGDGIPPITPFADPITVKLEVQKGQKYDLQKNKYVPETVAASPPILLKPLTEIKNAPNFMNWIVTDHPSNQCLSLKDHTISQIGQSIPKILHFSSDVFCKGKDQINLQYLKLPANTVFVEYQFQYQCMVFTQSGAGSWWSPCPEFAKLDQNLGDIKGATSLPDVTVSWSHSENQGVAYQLVITVEGPKGISW